MNLTIKFIVAITAIILLSYGALLYQTSNLQNKLVMEQARQQARILYKQILLTRQWVSDHHGLFLVKTSDVKENPFLSNSMIKADDGTVFVKRNPAMVTRELSEYAAESGFCWFRITSLNPVNPANKPDKFEKKALLQFEQGIKEIDAVTNSPDGRIHRYIAPLEVQDSCLDCHAEHGYKTGDIRGALSITVPLAWADEVIRKNNRTILWYAIFGVLGVALALTFLFNRLVANRIERLSQAMDTYPEEPFSLTEETPMHDDEIGNLIHRFENLCGRLEKAQEELDRTMQQAFYNEKMASLGQLTAGIAHEINNPLGGLLNCVKTLEEEPDNLEIHQRYMPLLEKGLKRIEHIMRQLLNFGRKVPLSYSKVDIDGIIRECFELLEYKLKNIRLNLELGVEEAYCIDIEAMRQIIVNMGLNAIQAMPDGGELTVTSKHSSREIMVRIEDTGMGIDPSVIDKIFDPFFTTKDVGEGTGLGLAVSYSLVRQMDGVIDVSSEAGKGTQFTIILPATQDCVISSTEKDSSTHRER